MAAADAPTRMLREAAEAPDVVARQFAGNRALVRTIGARLRELNPRARGDGRARQFRSRRDLREISHRDQDRHHYLLHRAVDQLGL